MKNNVNIVCPLNNITLSRYASIHCILDNTKPQSKQLFVLF